jgi:hypothetical protein
MKTEQEIRDRLRTLRTLRQTRDIQITIHDLEWVLDEVEFEIETEKCKSCGRDTDSPKFKFDIPHPTKKFWLWK